MNPSSNYSTTYQPYKPSTINSAAAAAYNPATAVYQSFKPVSSTAAPAANYQYNPPATVNSTLYKPYSNPAQNSSIPQSVHPYNSLPPAHQYAAANNNYPTAPPTNNPINPPLINPAANNLYPINSSLPSSNNGYKAMNNSNPINNFNPPLANPSTPQYTPAAAIAPAPINPSYPLPGSIPTPFSNPITSYQSSTSLPFSTVANQTISPEISNNPSAYTPSSLSYANPSTLATFNQAQSTINPSLNQPYPYTNQGPTAAGIATQNGNGPVQQYNQHQPNSIAPNQTLASPGMLPNMAPSMPNNSSYPSLAIAAPSIASLQQPIVPPWVTPVHPKYLSLSCAAFPNTNPLRLRSNIIYGGVLRPLADSPSSNVEPVAVVNPSIHGVIRCKDCRAYVNPFVQWLDAGARWRCNMCNLMNDVPQAYFSALDQNGRRLDIMERPELIHGSVEIIAPVDYMVRQPMPPTYFFVIDVSCASVQSGMLAVLSQALLKCLDNLPGDKRTLIGFITFDSTVHYYSLKPGQGSTPQMFVCADLEDIFLPVPCDLLVNLDESRPQVEQLVTSLATMHNKSKDVESASGAALEATLQVISRIGGRVLLFLSNIPSLGLGRLTNRDNVRLLGTSNEHTLLQPANDHYRKGAMKFTKFQICCDIFFFSDNYTDIATLSELSKISGGQCYYYPAFSAKLHSAKFDKELTRCLTRTQGWEAVVRVRASKGVTIGDFQGNFHLRGTDLLALPGIDCDKAFSFQLTSDDSTVFNTNMVTIQAALLYTTSSGERRIRVHTASIPITSILAELYDRVNTNALINILAKQSVPLCYKEGFDKARDNIRNRTVGLLRSHASAIQKQLAAPSAELSLLPLMTLGLLKNLAFKEGTDVRSDVRAYILAALYSMGIVELETFLRPRMLPLHDLNGNLGLSLNNNPAVELPTESSLTAEVLRSDTVYLIDNGMELLLRVGRQVNPQWLMSVFNTSNLDNVDSRALIVQPPSPNDTVSINFRLNNIINYLRSLSPHYQQLSIVKEGDPSEVRFFNLLIEDRNLATMSLAEFDQFIHRIQSY
jgi:protein transport protein SEC24